MYPHVVLPSVMGLAPLLRKKSFLPVYELRAWPLLTLPATQADYFLRHSASDLSA